MRQRENAGTMSGKAFHRIGHALLSLQVARLRVTSHEQCEAYLLERPQYLLMPERGTFRAWRQVAGGPLAGIAEAHRYQRDLRRIVELGLRKPGPLAQASAAIVVPRHAALMHLRSGRLADDDDPRGRTELHDRSWSRLQRLFAHRAGADFPQERCGARQ